MRQRIGRYEIIEAIASGGFATVYRARDNQLGRGVALKVLHSHMAADPQHVERFLREPRMAASLSHPNVVTIHEVGREGDTHFIAMEYLPYSLDWVLQQPERLAPSYALSIARQVALALQAAHQQGVVHRDLKPQNIMFTQDGTPKVTDFGIARAAELSTMTASGIVLGTPHYMSPEQAQGQRVDARSDIYSLGCVLYQMLTGALPFAATTPWEVVRQHIETPPRRVRQLQPDITAPVEHLVNRCLQKDPNRRYQSAGELADALGGLLGQAQGTARHQPVPAAEPAVARPRFGSQDSQERVKLAGGRGKWWLAGAVVVLLLAVVGGLVGAAAMRAGEGSTPASTPIPTEEMPTPIFTPASTNSPAPTATFTPTLQPPATISSPPFEVEFLTKWGSQGSGDGQFWAPVGIAVENSENVYVVDSGNYQKFDSRGTFLGKWNSQDSGGGQYYQYPEGIAVDEMGNVYVIDRENYCVQKFSSDGVFLVKWGTRGTGDGRFEWPSDIAVDSSGNVYISDAVNHRVQKFNSQGEFLAKWGSEGSSDGQFSGPWGIAADGLGNVYVADGGNYRVQKFNSDGCCCMNPKQAISRTLHFEK
jgi:serine/threonine protein kinase